METVFEKFETLEELKDYVLSYPFRNSDKRDVQLLIKHSTVEEGIYKLNWWGYRIPYTDFFLHHDYIPIGNKPGQVKQKRSWIVSCKYGAYATRQTRKSKDAALKDLFEAAEMCPAAFAFEKGFLRINSKIVESLEDRFKNCQIIIDPIKEE